MGDNELVLDVETLAERLEWARGAELLSSLEELEAITARRPDVARLALPALLNLLAEPTAVGAEATQQAIEIVGRLVSPVSSEDVSNKAAGAAGLVLVENPQHILVLLDVLESEACETYTAVVVLELFATLATRHAAALRRALLATPAGMARLVELLEERRDELRNASVALWERLTRPTLDEQSSVNGSINDADELRRCCAFNEGFVRIFAVMDREQHDSPNAVVRDAAALAANVLAGPDVGLTCISHAAPNGGLAPFVSLLRLPPVEQKAADERIDESFSPEKKKKHGDDPVDSMKRRDALRCAAAAVAALRQYVRSRSSPEDEDARREASEKQRLARQQQLWQFEPLREQLMALAFVDSELDPDDADITMTPEEDRWWVDLASVEHAPSRSRIRCAALAVLALALENHEAAAFDMCELRFASLKKKPLCARLVLQLATSSVSGAVALSAQKLSRALWVAEGAAVTFVMHGVAAPPSEDDNDDLSALSSLVSALEGEHLAPTRRALDLVRDLIARSAAVRELALRLTSGEDSSVFEVVTSKLQQEELMNPGLALVCTWVAECPTACHALLADSENATSLAKIAKTHSEKRGRGLACLALGLCLDLLTDDDESSSGWTQSALRTLLEKRVGLGGFGKVLQALKKEASSHRRDDPIFCKNDLFANLVVGAVDKARSTIISGSLTTTEGEEVVDASTDLEEQVEALTAEREMLAEALEQQAAEIARLASAASSASSGSAPASSETLSFAQRIAEAAGVTDTSGSIDEIEARARELSRGSSTSDGDTLALAKRIAEAAGVTDTTGSIDEIEARARALTYSGQSSTTSDMALAKRIAEAAGVTDTSGSIEEIEARARALVHTAASSGSSTSDVETLALAKRLAEATGVTDTSGSIDEIEARARALARPDLSSAKRIAEAAGIDGDSIEQIEANARALRQGAEEQAAEIARLASGSSDGGLASAKRIAGAVGIEGGSLEQLEVNARALSQEHAEALSRAKRSSDDALAASEAEYIAQREVDESLRTKSTEAADLRIAELETALAIAAKEKMASGGGDGGDDVAALKRQLAEAEAECDAAVDDLASMQDRVFAAEKPGKRLAELEALMLQPDSRAGLLSKTGDLEARLVAAEEVREMMEKAKNDAMRHAEETEKRLRDQAEEMEELKELSGREQLEAELREVKAELLEQTDIANDASVEEDLFKRLQQQEAKVEEAERRWQHENESNADLKNRLQEEEARTDHLETELQRLHEQEEALNAQIIEQRELFANTDASIDDALQQRLVEEQARSTQLDTTELQALRAAADRANGGAPIDEALQQRLQEEQARSAQLDTELLALRADLAQQSASGASVEDDLQRSLVEEQTRTAQLDSELQSLRADLVQQGEVLAASVVEDDLQGRLQEELAKTSQLQAELEEQSKTLQLAQQRGASSNGASGELQQALQEEQARTAQLDSELQALRAYLVQQREQAELVQQNGASIADLEEEQAKTLLLEGEIEALRREQGESANGTSLDLQEEQAKSLLLEGEIEALRAELVQLVQQREFLVNGSTTVENELQQALQEELAKTSQLQAELVQQRETLANGAAVEDDLQQRLQQEQSKTLQRDVELQDLRAGGVVQQGSAVEKGDLRRSLEEEQAKTSLLDVEMQSLRADLSNSTAVEDELQQALQEEEAKTAMLDTELQALHADLVQQRETLANTAVEDGLHHRLREEEAKTAQLGAELAKEQGKTTQLQAELVQQREIVSESTSVEDELQWRLQEEEAKTSQLQAELVQQREIVAESTSVEDDLHRSLQEEQGKTSQLQAELVQQRESSVEEELQRLLEEEQTKSSQLTTEVEVLHADYLVQQREAFANGSSTEEELQRRLQEEQSKSAQLGSELQALRADLANGSSTEGELQRRLQEEQSKAEALHADLVQGALTEGELQRRLQAEQAKTTEVENLRAELVQQREILSNSTSVEDDLQRRLEEEEAKTSLLDVELQGLRADVANNGLQEEVVQEEVIGLRAALLEHGEESEVLVEERRVMEMRLVGLERMQSDAQRVIDNERAMSIESERRRLALQEQYADLKVDKEELVLFLSQAKEASTRLEEELRETVEELDRSAAERSESVKRSTELSKKHLEDKKSDSASLAEAEDRSRRYQAELAEATLEVAAASAERRTALDAAKAAQEELGLKLEEATRLKEAFFAEAAERTSALEREKEDLLALLEVERERSVQEEEMRTVTEASLEAEKDELELKLQEASRMKDLLTAAEEQVSDEQGRYLALEREKEGLEMQLEAASGEAQERCLALEREKEALETQLSEMTSAPQLSEATERCSSLERELEALKEAVPSVEDDTAEALSEATDRCLSLEREKEAAQQHCSSLERELESAREEMANYSVGTGSLVEAQARQQEAQERCLALERQLAGRDMPADERCLSLERELSELREAATSRVENEAQEKAKRKTQREKVIAELASERRETVQLQDALAKEKTAQAELVAKCATLEAELDELQEEHDDYGNENLEAENLALLKRNEDLRLEAGEEIQALEARNAELEEQVEDLRTCEDDVAVLEKRCLKLQSEKKEMERTCPEDDVAVLQKKCQKLQSEKKDLESDVQDVKENSEEQRLAMLEEKQEALSMIEDKCLHLQLERDDFCVKLAAAEKQRSQSEGGELSQKCADLEETLAETEMERDEAMDELEALKALFEDQNPDKEDNERLMTLEETTRSQAEMLVSERFKRDEAVDELEALKALFENQNPDKEDNERLVTLEETTKSQAEMLVSERFKRDEAMDELEALKALLEDQNPERSDNERLVTLEETTRSQAEMLVSERFEAAADREQAREEFELAEQRSGQLLEEQERRLESELAKVQGRVSQLDAEKAELEERLLPSLLPDERVTELESQLEATRAELEERLLPDERVTELERQLKEAKAELEERLLPDDDEELFARLEMEKERLAIALEAEAQANSKCSEVEKRISAMDFELVEALERASTAEAALASLATESDETLQQQRDEAASEEILGDEDHYQELEDLRAELEAETRARIAAESAMSEDAARSEVDEAHMEVEELRFALEAAELRAEEDAARCEESEAMWEEQAHELSARAAKLASREEDVLKLKAELEDAKATAETARQLGIELEAAEDKVAALEAAAAGGGSELWKAERRARALDDELEAAKKLARDLETSLSTNSSPRNNNIEQLTRDVELETELRRELETLRYSNDNKEQDDERIVKGPASLRTEEDWQTLEDEHNDLLALLAQQELEKNALKAYVASVSGSAALSDVRKQAQDSCVQRYGIYVAYDDPAGPTMQPSPLQLDYDDQYDDDDDDQLQD